MFEFSAHNFGIDKKIEKYVNDYMKIQDMILFMQIKSCAKVVERIFASPFFKTEESIKEISHIIISASESKPKQINAYAELTAAILRSDNENVEIFKKAFVDELFMDSMEVRRRANGFRVFRVLISKGVFEISTVLDRLENMKCGECYYTVLLFFLDMIEPEKVDKLMEKHFEPKPSRFRKCEKKNEMCPAQTMLVNRAQLMNKNYELFKQYIKFGCKIDSIEYAIIIDDVELYKRYSKDKDIQQIGFHNENPFKMYDYFSEIKLVFIVGAMKIARYLHGQGRELKYERTCLGSCSSSEMVELWMNKSRESWEELVEGCAISHDWVFMEWLFDKCGNKLSGNHANDLMLKSSVRNFPRGIILAQSIKNYDLNIGDITGMNPLYFAIKNRNYCIAIMLASDPRIDIVLMRKDNNTLIHYAAKTGCTSLVRIMLQRGANPSYKNNHWNTPLHKAAKHGLLKIVKLLIEFKGDPNIANRKGKKPVDVTTNQEVKDYLLSLN